MAGQDLRWHQRKVPACPAHALHCSWKLVSVRPRRPDLPSMDQLSALGLKSGLFQDCVLFHSYSVWDVRRLTLQLQAGRARGRPVCLFRAYYLQGTW